MSQKVVIDLNVNTGKSKEDVKKVIEQTTDLKDSLKDVETQTKKTNKVSFSSVHLVHSRL